MKALLKKQLNRLKIYLNLSYQLQRKVRSKSCRDGFTQLSAKNKPKYNFEKTPIKLKDKLFELSTDGWTPLGVVIQPAEVDNLVSRLQKCPLHDRFRPELGFFDLNSIPQATHTADYNIDNWADFPEIIELANKKEYLDLAASYLGCKPTISNLQVWWSFPGHEHPEQAESFHRDVDDWKFFKLFVYLTDVCSESGPHTYVLGSKSAKTSLPIRRYTDQEIEKIFGVDKIKTLTGAKGEAFIEDTFGFHKGALPKQNKRLLLQIQYSINPIKIKKYKPFCTKIEYDEYINRLYFK
ncbi:hypothetical protein PSH55_16915 [Pseudoalteromonas sp. Angola-31]|nr:hypothetical protein [Pseudoalteromonas sp. Angola-31]